MQKNTASQVIGAQLVSATDGSAFTGSVTCYVTGDGGTQAVGSVGSGACTHEGNGYHTYAPAQAETNYNLIAFTFTGTGAVPVTVQVFTALDVRTKTGFSIGSGGITASSFAAGAVDAAAIAADAGVEIGRAVWNVDISGDLTSGLAGNTLYANVYTPLANLIADIGANGSGLTALPWNASWDAEVQSECADALAAFWTSPAALVDLVWDETLTAHATADSAAVHLKDTLADTADLQANQGNWITATGFSTHSAADVWAVATRVLTASTNITAGIADAVWEEAIADHSGTAGSTAEALNAAGSAGDPWTTSLPGSYTGSQAGKMLSDILTDTAEIGSAGAGLTEAGGTGDQFTAIPWNAAWDAEVQSECTDALNAYDPPTNTEMTTAFTEIKGATWATTDTLEAIRDRGDAAWTTATGFSTHSAADVRTEIDSNSTQLASIVADTNELQTDWANGGRLDLILDASAALFTTTLSESYRAADAVGTPSQILQEILQGMSDFVISGTTKTVRKRDSATTAKTYTLNDGTTPTGITEAT